MIEFSILISFPSQIKPLHDEYINEVSQMIWEQLNRFWAESYEACKASSQKRTKNLMESRRKFQVSTFNANEKKNMSQTDFNYRDLCTSFSIWWLNSKKSYCNGECDKLMKPIDLMAFNRQERYAKNKSKEDGAAPSDSWTARKEHSPMSKYTFSL